MRFWSDCGKFIRESRRHFHEIGAVLPSSRFLARALVSEMKKRPGPCRLLEVGPGTGPVTAQLVRQLQPGDRVDLVELNEQFIAHLRKRFDSEEAFVRCRDQVTLINSPVEKLTGESVYDYIISGLPLNNFPAQQVREIFRVFKRLLKPGGTLSYFEYLWVRQLKSPFVGQRQRSNLARVGRVVGCYIRDCEVRRQRVFINVPPAMARHLLLKPNGHTVSAPLSHELSGEKVQQL
ncbi:MAG TPA: methyltransferase domain-containing protein [Gemmataceae bacterium]|jgi:phospholipid N-methyltransferase|nr:methyltransferase domain-containing protein [Gemmataceae bacterium]